MTNYNERLDEILELLHNSWLEDDYDPKDPDANEAKQAITSLTKELVAEAKPKKPKHIEITEPIVGIDRLWQQGRDVGYASGQADAIDKFEQNLLKALEEK